MYINKTLIYFHPELDKQNRKGINKYTHALARKYELEKTQRESMSAKAKSRDLRLIKRRESATVERAPPGARNYKREDLIKLLQL